MRPRIINYRYRNGSQAVYAVYSDGTWVAVGNTGIPRTIDPTTDTTTAATTATGAAHVPTSIARTTIITTNIATTGSQAPGVLPAPTPTVAPEPAPASTPTPAPKLTTPTASVSASAAPGANSTGTSAQPSFMAGLISGAAKGTGPRRFIRFSPDTLIPGDETILMEDTKEAK